MRTVSVILILKHYYDGVEDLSGVEVWTSGKMVPTVDYDRHDCARILPRKSRRSIVKYIIKKKKKFISKQTFRYKNIIIITVVIVFIAIAVVIGYTRITELMVRYYDYVIAIGLIGLLRDTVMYHYAIQAIAINAQVL